MKFSRLLICLFGVFVFYTLIPSCKKSTKVLPQNTAAVEISQLLANTTDSVSISLLPSFEAAKKALALSQSTRNDTLIIQSWLTMGSNFRLRGKNDEAFALFQNAFQLSGKIGYERGQCQSLIESGTLYYIRGQYSKSGELFQKALKIAQQNKYSGLEASAHNYNWQIFAYHRKF